MAQPFFLPEPRIEHDGAALRKFVVRFNNACRSRIGSAYIAPIVASQRTATWFPFFAANGSIVLMTPSINGLRAKDSR
jgi:hypothetical protein